ncbi:hypothetical protein K438DRAFT_1760401 [Mycena galopus ATCC 62051]|nr:hypothetical protein K438DRAFT_1760401 [Mycena galopus ATCC 62051]
MRDGKAGRGEGARWWFRCGPSFLAPSKKEDQAWGIDRLKFSSEIKPHRGGAADSEAGETEYGDCLDPVDLNVSGRVGLGAEQNRLERGEQEVWDCHGGPGSCEPSRIPEGSELSSTTVASRSTEHRTKETRNRKHDRNTTGHVCIGYNQGATVMIHRNNCAGQWKRRSVN